MSDPNAPSMSEMLYPGLLQVADRTIGLSNTEIVTSMQLDPRVWVEWSLSALSGDELVVRRPVETFSTTVIPFLGREVKVNNEPRVDYRLGDLTRRFNELYESNDPVDRVRLKRMSQTLARFTFVVELEEAGFDERWWQLMPTPQTLITSDERGQPTVVFTEEDVPSIPLEGPIDSVASFGPGLSGREFAGELAGRSKEAHLISGGMGADFISHWNEAGLEYMNVGIREAREENRLHEELPPGVDEELYNVPDLYSYSNGIAEAVPELPDKMDVIVMSAVHTAGMRETMAGLRGAREKLRHGGYLVVKAPDISLGNEAGMDFISSEAFRLLGSPMVSGACGTMGQIVDPTLPGIRPASYAIYQK